MTVEYIFSLIQNAYNEQVTIAVAFVAIFILMYSLREFISIVINIFK